MEQGALGEKQKQERENVLNKVEQGQAIDDKDIQSFSRFRQGQYTGPRGIENKEQLLEQADRGQAIAGSVNTQQGRQGLLQQFSSSPKYTRGSLRTDALLLGQEAPKLQEAATGLRGVSRNVQTAARSAEEQAKQAELKTQEFGRETENILENRFNQTINPAQQAQKNALDKFGELQNALTAKLDKSNFNAHINALEKYAQEIRLDPKVKNNLIWNYDYLKRTGLTPEQAGATLIESMKLNQQGLGKLQQLGTFMDQGTANKIAALQRLSGKEVQDFGEIGGYMTADTSALGKLIELRQNAMGKNSQADFLNDFYNNRKKYHTNALKGDQFYRNFFIQRDPGLAEFYADYDNAKRSKKESEMILAAVEIDRRINRIANNLAAERDRLREQADRQLQIKTLNDYLNYINSI
jgi:hypothetical protein